MANSYPGWFDAEFFAGQKLMQIEALRAENPANFPYELPADFPADATNLAKLDNLMTQFGVAEGTAEEKAWANFEACNTYPESNPGQADKYDSVLVKPNQVNVSPNGLFDIPYYLSAVAANANKIGFSTDKVAAGNWNAENVLDHMYNDLGYTAWEHYQTEGVKYQLDCSANFDFGKYISLKSVATGKSEADVLAELQESGKSALEDFFDSNLNTPENLAQLTVPVEDQPNVTMQPGGQWGDVSPEWADPYDDYQADPVIIEAGKLEGYFSEAGKNTQFKAAYLSTDAGSTLDPNDVIEAGGGGALNTLTVELGRDWDGFNGIAPEDDPFALPSEYAPNVTGISRVEINRQSGLGSNSEQHLTFDASNMEGVKRIDINAAGTGATDLTSLQSTVQRVNLAGQLAMNAAGEKGLQETNISYADGEQPDALTIGLKNMGGTAKVGFSSGVDTITVDSMVGSSNGVDIFDSTGSGSGVKNLAVTGNANVSVRANAEGIEAINAGEANGDVSLFLYNMDKGKHMVTGGSGNDTVTLGNNLGTVSAANWTKVENVAFDGGEGADVTFNMKDSADITDLWFTDQTSGKEGTYNVTNAFGNLNVHQEGAVGATVSVKGASSGNQLKDINWDTGTGASKATGVKANFTTNAAGTVSITTNGQDFLADDSSFALSDATTIKLTQNGAASASYTNGVTLDASKAVNLDITANGALSIKGTQATTALKSVQNLTVNLTAANVSGVDDVFDMSAVDLAALRTATVNAGGESVTFGKIGQFNSGDASASKGPGFTMTINDADDVTFGDMGSALGGTIKVQINDAEGGVALANVGTSTNATYNQQGDVYMNITSGEALTVTSGSVISGGELYLNFAGVGGNLAPGSDAVGASDTRLTLDAEVGIQYTGAAGNDYLTVSGVGTGRPSVVSTGSGDDAVFFAAGSLGDGSKITVNLGEGSDGLAIDAGAVVSGKATVYVTCGDGVDTLTPAAQTAGAGSLIMYVSGFEQGEDIIAGTFAPAVIGAFADKAAENFNSAFGTNISTNGKIITIGTGGTAMTGLYADGNVYFTADGAGTLVVLQGVTPDADGVVDINGAA